MDREFWYKSGSRHNPLAAAAAFIRTKSQFSADENDALAELTYLNMLRGSYRTPEQRIQHFLITAEQESPKHPGTIGSVLVELKSRVVEQLQQDRSLLRLLQVMNDPELSLDRTLGPHGLPEFVRSDDAAILRSELLGQLHGGVYGEPKSCLKTLSDGASKLGKICVDAINRLQGGPDSRILDCMFLGTKLVGFLLQSSSLYGSNTGIKSSSPHAVVLSLLLSTVHAYVIQDQVERGRIEINNYHGHLRAIAKRIVGPHRIEKPHENQEILAELKLLQLCADKFEGEARSQPGVKSIEEAIGLMAKVSIPEPDFNPSGVQLALPEARIRLAVYAGETSPIILLLSGPEQQVSLGIVSEIDSWPDGLRFGVAPPKEAKRRGNTMFFKRSSINNHWFPQNQRIELLDTPLLERYLDAQQQAMLTSLATKAWGLVMGIWLKLPEVFDAAPNFTEPLSFNASLMNEGPAQRWQIKLIASDATVAAVTRHMPKEWDWFIGQELASEPAPTTGSAPKVTNLGRTMGFQGLKPRSVLRALIRLGVKVQRSKGSHLKFVNGERTWISGRSVYAETKPMPYWAISSALRSLGLSQEEFLAAAKLST